MKTDAGPTAPGNDSVQKAIERAKQELEQMIDLNPQGMLLVSRDGLAARANRAMLELLGHTDFRLVLGKPLTELFPCQDAAFFDRLLRSTSGYESCEAETTASGGSRRTLRFTVVNPGAKGELIVLIVHDITGEKAKSKHLEKEYKREVVEALMGALMHNINQPLTVILVRAHLMQLAIEKGGQPSAELHKSLRDIVTLTMQIADTLRRLETPADYVTQSYIAGVDIIDIKRSGGRDSRWESFCIHALDSLLGLLDVHEPGAALHARRTTEYAVHLARHLGLKEDVVETVRLGAAYHDIGKIGIPDSILQKPAPLSADERDLINRHSETGYHLLNRFPFLSAAAQAIHAHHERFDGTGYPRGLSKERIPLASRIVSVADTFDALRFYRFYHDPAPLENTVREIKAHSGTQFDPIVVGVFFQCYRDLDALFPHAPAANRLS